MSYRNIVRTCTFAPHLRQRYRVNWFNVGCIAAAVAFWVICWWAGEQFV